MDKKAEVQLAIPDETISIKNQEHSPQETEEQNVVVEVSPNVTRLNLNVTQYHPEIQFLYLIFLVLPLLKQHKIPQITWQDKKYGNSWKKNI